MAAGGKSLRRLTFLESRMKRWGILFLLCPTLFSAGARAAAEINTIVKVEVRGSTVEIVGSKQPSFTTFTMTDPPRLVVDIAEAVFSGVPDQQPGSGLVSWIKTASYGSDASAIARVLIAFTKEVETDLTTAGGKLVVKIIAAPAPAVARADKPAGTARPEAPKEADAPPKLQLATGSESSEATASPEPARGNQAGKLKEAFAKASQEREDAERQEHSRRAEAEKRREQEERARIAEQERAAQQQRLAQAEQAKREAAAEAKQKAEEERLAQEKARAQAEQAKREAAAEAKQKAQEERLALEKARAQAEQAKQEAAAEAKQKAQEERLAQEKAKAEAEQAKREAAAEAKQKAQEERLGQQKARAEAEQAKREAAAEAKQTAQEERLAQQKATAEAEQANREAAAERKRQAREARASRQQERASSGSRRRANMTFVGFQQAPSSSRVYVRTSGPVSYSVQEDGDKRVILELENTRIALRNNRRPLDTSFFDSAVAMVAPSVGRGMVRVEIKLKEHASFQAKQDGNEVSVEFSRAPHP